MTGARWSTPAPRRARVLLWTGLGVGLGAYLANRLLLTWIYNDLDVETAMALSNLTDPILTFLGVVGAVLFASALASTITSAPATPAAVEASSTAVGHDGDELHAELLPPSPDEVPATDGFRASYRVDFAGRWGGTERFRLTETHDVRRAIAWATTQAEGRAFEIWLEHADDNGVTQISLTSDPPAPMGA